MLPEETIDQLRNIMRGTIVTLHDDPIEIVDVGEMEMGDEPLIVKAAYRVPVEADFKDDPEVAIVDMGTTKFAIQRRMASERKNALQLWLASYPYPTHFNGDSYKELGEAIGSEAAALATFAFGETLGLFSIVKASTVGGEGDGVFVISRASVYH